MSFGCIYVPNFMVQAVVRSEPALRERAVALVDGTAPVWSVVGVNEEGARAGIARGMTKSQAQQFCEIEIRHRSRAQEKAAHAALLDLGWSVSPRVEDTAADTIVVDLAGLNSLFGQDGKIAAHLAERAWGLGLIAQIAVASKIDVAILAARGYAGVTVIADGEEAKILGSLPVGVLSPSAEVLETLERWAVRTCEALAALPVLPLSERLGQEGVRLQALTQGQSEHAFVVAEPEIHFEEEMELDNAVEELEPLSFLLGRLLDQLCARLEARSLAACTIRMKFELDSGFEAGVEGVNRSAVSPRLREPGSTATSTVSSPAIKIGETPCASSQDESAPQKATIAAPRLPKIYERVLSLPVAMRDSKMLLKLVRLHLQAEPPRAPILKIFLAADAARPRVSQGGLFLSGSPDPEKLELTLARLANLASDLYVGSPELMDTYRPGEFRMRRFAALQDQKARPPENRASTEHSSKTKQETQKPKTGFRVFRPALRAKVDLRNGCPARIGFQGKVGRVVAASGPWRSSGDWWREDGWNSDEWDLEVEFSSALYSRQHGFYRIYFDSIQRMWFVRGAYD